MLGLLGAFGSALKERQIELPSIREVTMMKMKVVVLAMVDWLWMGRFVSDKHDVPYSKDRVSISVCKHGSIRYSCANGCVLGND